MCLGEWTVKCLCGECDHECNSPFMETNNCIKMITVGFFLNKSKGFLMFLLHLIWCHLCSSVELSYGCASPQDGDACRVPGSGIRCRGFHPLESIREAAGRWKMATRRRKKEGPRLNPATLPYLPPPPPPPIPSHPIPSRPLPSLFNAFATPHISARIVSCNRASGGAGSPFWIPMLQNMPQPLPKCLWSDVAKGKCTQAEQVHGCQSDKTDIHISNPFTVIEESRLKCNCRPRPPRLFAHPKLNADNCWWGYIRFISGLHWQEGGSVT